VVSPSTGEKLASYGVASPADVAEAAGIAAEAQRSWARVSGDEKSRILRRAGDAMEANVAVLGDWLMREAGSGQGKAAFESGRTGDRRPRWTAAEARAPGTGRQQRAGRDG
jgi:benzaldehyde dehydrogenase (NAD)